MAHTIINFKTKKALGEAIAAGDVVRIEQNFIGATPTDGSVSIEGPHEYHKWYAEGTLKDGRLISAR